MADRFPYSGKTIFIADRGYESYNVFAHIERKGMNYLTRFSIQKVDPQHRPLEGVEYGLFREDGTLHVAAVTDSDGLATFEQIPYGSYTI